MSAQRKSTPPRPRDFELKKINGPKGLRFHASNGCVFHLQKTGSNGKHYVHCIRRTKKDGSCNGRGILDPLTGAAKETVGHNHPPDWDEQLRDHVMNEAINDLRENPKTRGLPKVLFRKAKTIHRGKKGFANFDGSAARRIQREKRKRQPLVPPTLEEAEELLREFPEYSETADDKPFFRESVVSEERKGDNGVAFVFTSPLIKQLGETNEIHGDATFKTIPKVFSGGQLFTVHAVVGQKSYPVVYALMTRKTTKLYEAVLKSMKNAFRERYSDHSLNIELVVTDYEKAMMKAFRKAFRGASVEGCWFHYGQAIIKYVRGEGLSAQYGDETIVTEIVQGLIALALLPPDLILDGFAKIKQVHRDALKEEPRDTQRAITKVYAYWNNFWYDDVTPEVFSVFERCHRTNNLVESWHKIFNTACVIAHPNFWDFMVKLIDSEADKRDELKSFLAGKKVGMPRIQKYKDRDALIKENEKDLHDKKLSIHNFLKRSRYLFNVDLASHKRKRTEQETEVGFRRQRRRIVTRPEFDIDQYDQYNTPPQMETDNEEETITNDSHQSHVELAEEAPDTDYANDHSFDHQGIQLDSLSESVEEFVAEDINTAADEEQENDNWLEQHEIPQDPLTESVEKFIAEEIDSAADEDQEEDYSLSDGFPNVRAQDHQGQSTVRVSTSPIIRRPQRSRFPPRRSVNEGYEMPCGAETQLVPLRAENRRGKRRVTSSSPDTASIQSKRRRNKSPPMQPNTPGNRRGRRCVETSAHRKQSSSIIQPATKRGPGRPKKSSKNPLVNLC